MKKNITFKAGAVALSLLLLGGCAKNKEVDPSITNIAVTSPDFQMLEDAAIRCNLAVKLGNKNPDDPQGNYTVFAPTNAAFARLGLNNAADLAALNTLFLYKTLLYNVFSGALPGDALKPGSTSVSAQGGPTRRIIKRDDGSLYVNGSRILSTDARAANGLIHSTDKVLLATGLNIVASAQALEAGDVFVKPELTFLVEAVKYADLVGLLSSSSAGPFTVFAPTDQAFRDLGVLIKVPLNQPSDIRKLPKAQVRAVLLNNAISGALGDKFTSELPANKTVMSAGGAPLVFGPFSNSVLTVKGASNAIPANMVVSDVQCTNGVVHVIDQVLLP